MTHGAVLQNETGPPSWNRPLLIASTIKSFLKKSRKKETEAARRGRARCWKVAGNKIKLIITVIYSL
jgi:hypothetical protein